MSTQVEQLFLLEFLVDNIKLNDEPPETETEGEQPERDPIRVRVKFIEFPWFEINQHQESLEEDGSFNAGKSHLFPMAPIMLIKNLQRYPLAVTIYRVNKENPLPDLIGQTRVKMTDGMTEAVQSAMHCNCNSSLPITCTLKDTYSLRNIGGEVGTITLFIRLTCFGQSIVTQFQLGEEKKAFLFQHSKPEDSTVCKTREDTDREPKEKENPTKYDILTSSPFLTDEDTLFDGDCPCDGATTDDTTINWKLPPPPPPPVVSGCGCSAPAEPAPPQYAPCPQLAAPPPPVSGCCCSTPAQPAPSCPTQQSPPPRATTRQNSCQSAPSPQSAARCACGASEVYNMNPEPVAPEPEPVHREGNQDCDCGFEDGDVSSLVHTPSCTCGLEMPAPPVVSTPSCICSIEIPPPVQPIASCTCGFVDGGGDYALTKSSTKGSCAGGEWGDGMDARPGATSQMRQIEMSKTMEGRGDNGDMQGRKPSILVKDVHSSASGKRVSVVEAREKKVKKKRHNFTFKYGVQYPGIKCGHVDCVMANCQVPPHMGWLWNAKCPNRVLKLRKGWRPGAVGFTIAQIINTHRRQAGLNEINKPQRSKFKRGRKVGKDGKVEGDQPPTLHVHRKDGAYYISMHPLNLGGETEQIPLEFTIPKRKGSEYDSESTESELEFDFMAPGAFEPKKPPVKFRSFGTQYADKDCSSEKLQLKGGKGKKDKKGKKEKKAESMGSGPEGRAKGGMSWDADPPTALEKGKSANKKK